MWRWGSGEDRDDGQRLTGGNVYEVRRNVQRVWTKGRAGYPCSTMYGSFRKRIIRLRVMYGGGIDRDSVGSVLQINTRTAGPAGIKNHVCGAMTVVRILFSECLFQVSATAFAAY